MKYFYRKKFRIDSPLPVSGTKKPPFVRAQIESAPLPCRVHLGNGVTAELGVGDPPLPSLLSALNGLLDQIDLTMWRRHRALQFEATA